MKIAVFTCDKYTELLKLTRYFLQTFWPDCPYPVIVVCETYGLNEWDSMPLGPGLTWSEMARRFFLRQDADEPILLLLDDYMICRPVDNESIRRYEQIMIDNPDIAYIRLIPCPGPELNSEWGDLGEFHRNQSYLVSLQATIWRPRDMLNFLDPGENPWQFELIGSKRIRWYPRRFLGTKEYKVIEYKNMMRRGKVNPKANEWLKAYANENNLGLDSF
jgi:hypothetical protein